MNCTDTGPTIYVCGAFFKFHDKAESEKHKLFEGVLRPEEQELLASLLGLSCAYLCVQAALW